MADRVRAGFRTIAGLGAGAIRSGLLHPIRPDRALRLALPMVRYGTSPATLSSLAALRFPGRTAVIDELGIVSYEELEHRSAALATALTGKATAGRRVGIMCRNHRGFVEATLAGSRLGRDVVFLNTDFSAPQLASVLDREEIGLLILDEEFVGVAAKAGHHGPQVIAWYGHEQDVLETGGSDAPPTIDDLVRITEPAPVHAERTGKLIILTSGTTGTPKGASHDLSLPSLVAPAIAHMTTVPLHSGEPILVAPPLFHVLGLGYLNIALALGAPVVLCRRFTPDDALRAIERHQVRALVGVPLMLQRILEAASADAASPEATSHKATSAEGASAEGASAERARAQDTAADGELRVVICGGAPLPPSLIERFTATFGDVLYNVYGATEAGWATIATPDDLRAAPGTVGRVSWGVTLKLLDDDGQEVPRGEVGRVFFGGGGIDFAGYSGGDKEAARSRGGRLVATGDVGHFDADGRLFIDGRIDDMIVSGGENVFPVEVENLLAGHKDVKEVAVTGVDDPEFGQRLVAHVVRAPGSSIGAEELRSYVRDRLARYKVPREVTFVDELPRTTTGKIQHANLRNS